MGSFPARQQGNEQEELWMGGVYEPDPSVGSSTLILLVHSLIIRYHGKGGWGIEFSCVAWKKRRWICDSLFHKVILVTRFLDVRAPEFELAHNLDQASSLPSPSPPLALGAWASPDSSKTFASICSRPPISLQISGNIFIFYLWLWTHSLSQACPGSCLNTDLSLMPLPWPLIPMPTDSVSSSLSVSCEEYHISMLVASGVIVCLSLRDCKPESGSVRKQP